MGGSTLPQAASEVTNDGIPLIAGCTKQNHCSQVQGMPKPRNFFSMTPASGRVSDHLVQALSKLAPSANLAGFRLEQSIPAGLSLDAGSVRPDATVEHRGGATHLSWSWENELASEPHTVTYRVSPLDAGRWDLAGGITLMDQNGSQSSTVLASQPLTATGPCGMTPTPTATATDPPPPTATRTPPPPTATNTPVPPTATPTATATPLPGPVYLPVAIREHCKPDERLGDIVLVIDASGSMDRSTEDGVPKKTAVLQTARAFVDRLDLSPNDAGQSDQVAVVGFNAEAWIQQPLTSDGAAISAALGALYDRQAAGTRLDLAFDGGLAALDPAARKPGNKPVIVLLTDGLPTGVPDDPASGRPEETVIAAAARARAAGVVIYTIGFGHGDESADPSDRVYPWLLAQCASDAGKTFVEPRADRLQEIYLEIADVFTCPEGRHDWGRAWP